ncbi:MAG TPA: extracellular solute-binding protein [Propionibacteriaceae bacterium]|nr:extracellular solute-binding protein [Propionibacteriaceae bacterium]
MAVTRRQFLIRAGLAAAAASGGLTACAPGSGGEGSQNSGGDGTTELALAWWGNPTRNKNTQAEIDAYMKANPKVKISPQPGEFSSYWEKLATQTAGGTAPDIIQMDMAFISEYGNRGALLDLSAVDTSKFVEGTVDAGRIDGKLVGINAGINSLIVLANPAVFEKAKMDLPDDTTWTWDEMMEVSAEVASKSKVPFGAASIFGGDGPFGTWLRQNGKELFTPEGLGFEAADAQAWFDMMVKFEKAKAIGTAQQISEEGLGPSAKPLDQSALVVGKAAMQTSNTNQLEAINAASGEEMKMLRFPSLTGKATDRKAWYKASMLWSASAKTKNPDAAVAWINWWVNTQEAVDIDKAERGIPANADLQAYIAPKLSPAQQTVSKFISDIKPELAATPIAPPPGGGTLTEVMFRNVTNVLFGKASTADAAKKVVDELASNLTV